MRNPIGGRSALVEHLIKEGAGLIGAMSNLIKDEDGAALIEYTVLLGILLVAVIATIGLVGGWISGRWTSLQQALPP